MDAEQRSKLLDGVELIASRFARRVAPAYSAMRWTWREEGIPSAGAIGDLIRRHVDSLRKNVDYRAVESGGIRVELLDADEVNELPCRVNLLFKLEETVYGWDDKS